MEAVINGHHLANHGKTNSIHALKSYYDLNLELTDCQRAIEDIYRQARRCIPFVKYYRPGCGYVNDVIESYCKNNNYKIVLGSNYPSDPTIPIGKINKFYSNNN